MQIESIKTLNITGLFSVPIEHKLVSSDTLLNAIKDPGQDKVPNSSIIEAPGLKVVIIPELKKEFIFENVRVLVNDKAEVSPDESKVIDDFFLLLSNNLIDREKLTAYGFNFDVIVTPRSDFKFEELIGKKISDLPNISSAGVNINFGKEDQKYNFEMKPLGTDNKYLAHLNVHFTADLPETTELRKEFLKQYSEFETLISKI